MKSLIGKKIGMGQIIRDNGEVVAVTFVEAGPCTVTQIKTVDSDGYNAVQVGYGENSKLNKAQAGHVKNAKVMPKIFKEFINDNLEEVTVGTSFDSSVFEVGDMVKVSSTSKGKGFAGTVKRWNFNTSKKSHGGNGVVRAPGSIGSMYPQKIFKGKKMAGQLGAKKVSIKNQSVELVDAEKNLIAINGSVPGPKGTIITVEGVK